MRFFFQQLKSDWAPLKGNWHGYRSAMVRYSIKNIIFEINEEIVVFLYNIKINPTFFLWTLIVLASSVGITLYVPLELIKDLLEKSVQGLFGFITIFITAAIFIATLTSTFSSKQSEEIRLLNSGIQNIDNIFKDLYFYSRDYTDENQKWILMCAHAAESVFDQGSYMEFRDWYRTIESDFAGGNFEASRKFPFDIAANATVSDRWAIKQGLQIAETDLQTRVTGVYDYLKNHKAQVRQLKSVVGKYSYPNVGFQPYGFGSFIGSRLTRVVLYGLTAIVLAIIFNTVSGQQHNLVTGVDLHFRTLLEFSAVCLSLGAITISIRYMTMFLKYLKANSPYYNNMGGAEITPMSYDESSQGQNIFWGR